MGRLGASDGSNQDAEEAATTGRPEPVGHAERPLMLFAVLTILTIRCMLKCHWFD